MQNTIYNQLRPFLHLAYNNLYSKSGFPFYDIIKVDETKFRVDIATAGFKREELDVYTDKGMLIIKGEPSDCGCMDDEGCSDCFKGEQYITRTIKRKPFTREFSLGEYVEVKSASYNDGILSISLERVIPEEQKPNKINIK